MPEYVLAESGQSRVAATFATWLALKSVRTQEAYIANARAFAAHCNCESPMAAFEWLATLPRPKALHVVETWKARMRLSGLAPNSINQRLAMVRSFVKALARYGVTEWTLDVVGLRPEVRRETEGPAYEVYVAMVAAEPSARNRAIIRLMGDRGLRRSEVSALQIEDVDAERERIHVLRKGRRMKKWLRLGLAASAALDTWISERGREPGPLFGVAADTIHKIVQTAGERVGKKVWPHGLRHLAVTRALDKTNGDVRKVQQFADHASPKMTLVYDDQRRSHADEVARLFND